MGDEQDEHEERDEHDERPEVFGEREPRDDEFERYLAGLAAPYPGGRREWWRLLGQAVAVVLVVGGLVVIGFMAFILIALNSWGSNK